jgi:hypothetical protein
VFLIQEASGPKNRLSVIQPSFEKCSDGKTLCEDNFSFNHIQARFRDEAEAYYRSPEDRELGSYAYHARN